MARYLLRPPVSLERRQVGVSGEEATCRVKRSASRRNPGAEMVERFDPRELPERILMHVAEPRAHQVRY